MRILLSIPIISGSRSDLNILYHLGPDIMAAASGVSNQWKTKLGSYLSAHSESCLDIDNNT